MCAHPLAQVDRDHLDDHDLTAADDRTGQGPHALHVEEAVAT
ncbi:MULTISPECIES: hypothetical protein [Mycolicibacterium]|nr:MULTISPECIES: hypothetical protein [Mycolicibacterium]